MSDRKSSLHPFLHETVTQENEETYRKFHKLVNMSASEIESFLKTDGSKKVGYKKKEGEESIGHQSGRHIIRILKKKKSELTEDDYRHMRKVCGYISRHTAQGGPSKDKATSPWRYSLMNWGHDPLK